MKDSRDKRSRRLKKKLHCRYIKDVRCFVSMSEEWLSKLLESDVGKVFFIENMNGSLPFVDEYGLQFCVVKFPSNLKDQVRFCFLRISIKRLMQRRLFCYLIVSFS